MKTIATLTIAAALLASTATADTTRDLAECYYERSLTALGVDIDAAESDPALSGMVNNARISMYKTALAAVVFMRDNNNLDLLNMVSLVEAVEPEIGNAFVECNNRFFAY
jgi:hypothetical protein